MITFLAILSIVLAIALVVAIYMAVAAEGDAGYFADLAEMEFATNARHSQDNLTLNHQIDTQKQTLDANAADIAKYKDQIQKDTQYCADLRDHIAGLNIKLIQAYNDNSHSQTQHNADLEQLSSLRDQLQQAKAQLAKNKETFDDRVCELERTLTERDQVRKYYNESVALNDSMLANIRSLETENQNLKTANLRLEQQIATMDAVIRSNEQSITVGKSHHDTQTRAYSRLRAVLADKCKELSATAKDLNATAADLAKFQSLYAASDQELLQIKNLADEYSWFRFYTNAELENLHMPQDKIRSFMDSVRKGINFQLGDTLPSDYLKISDACNPRTALSPLAPRGRGDGGEGKNNQTGAPSWQK